ncbi:hypothetical protein [Shimia sp. R9_2]|uniref:hypothetical protein n=1 Tax=Shimia sp. R9_2 TaxID=2821112 RepID=UPI0032AED854
MLSIARETTGDRGFCLIDEPTNGSAPAIVSTMAQALRQLKVQRAYILLVEQNFRWRKRWVIERR